jgi:serine/threonine protein kinase
MALINHHYRIETLLGRGGIGDTYRALDIETGQTVALKAVSLVAAASWKSVERFEREVEVLQQLQHPGIPHYLDAFYVDQATDCTYYIVQTLAPGASFQSLIETGWRTSEPEIRAIAAQILEILTYLHQQELPSFTGTSNPKI